MNSIVAYAGESTRAGFWAAVMAMALGACGPSHEETTIDYSAEQVQSAIEGHWIGTLTRADGSQTSIDLDLVRRQNTVQPQCGTTVFVHPPCSPDSTMALLGTLSTGDHAFDNVSVSGEIRMGWRFDVGGLLHLDAAQGPVLSALFTDGSLRTAAYPSDQLQGAFTLLRGGSGPI